MNMKSGRQERRRIDIAIYIYKQKQINAHPCPSVKKKGVMVSREKPWPLVRSAKRESASFRSNTSADMLRSLCVVGVFGGLDVLCWWAMGQSYSLSIPHTHRERDTHIETQTQTHRFSPA